MFAKNGAGRHRCERDKLLEKDYEVVWRCVNMDWYKFGIKLVYNLLLWAVCLLFSLGLIQHSMFFYSFPPDPNRYVNVSFAAYVVLGLILFVVLKLQYRLAKRSELLDEE